MLDFNVVYGLVGWLRCCCELELDSESVGYVKLDCSGC